MGSLTCSEDMSKSERKTPGLLEKPNVCAEMYQYAPFSGCAIDCNPSAMKGSLRKLPPSSYLRSSSQEMRTHTNVLFVTHHTQADLGVAGGLAPVSGNGNTG